MNNRSIVPASVTKRSFAYLVDVMFIGIPLALAVSWALGEVHGTAPLVGWGVIVAVSLIGVAYGVVLAAQSASTGQTAGKRIMGLRTVRAESLKPAEFGESFQRGTVFFIGLLGLGIAPLLTAIRTRSASDEELWPHRRFHTRVIDIRQGRDPLSTQSGFYPEYPEEWIAGLTPHAVRRWPPTRQDPVASRSVQDEPARVTQGDHEERERRDRRNQGLRAAAQGLLTAMATVGVIVAVTVSAAALKPPAAQPRDEHEVLASSLQAKLPVAGYSGEGLQGYRAKPDWSHAVSGSAKVFATPSHVLSIDNRTVTIYSSATGKIMGKIPVSSTVSLCAPTVFAGKPGFYWEVGGTAFGWREGVKKPFQAKIPVGAKPYAAGGELLFGAQTEGKNAFRVWRFTDKGFQEIKVPSGTIPGSFTPDGLLSYSSSGDMTTTDSAGKAVSHYPLTSPRDGLQFAGVVATGHERVVGLWSPYPDATAENTPVVIAFYDSTDGSLLAYIETTRGRIDKYRDLTWSPDGASALFAGYMFETATGLPVLDLMAQGIEPVSTIGVGVLGSSPLGNVFVRPDSVNSIAGVDPLLATRSAAIIKTRSNSIEHYSH
jgi:hypothetical protein